MKNDKTSLRFYAEIFNDVDGKGKILNNIFNKKIKLFVFDCLVHNKSILFSQLQMQKKSFMQSSYYNSNKKFIDEAGLLRKEFYVILKERFDKVNTKLNCMGISMVEEDYDDDNDLITSAEDLQKEGDDNIQLINKDLYLLESHHNFFHFNNALFESAGDCKFKYNFNQSQLLDFNMNTVQQVDLFINSKIDVLIYPARLHYHCNKCENGVYINNNKIMSNKVLNCEHLLEDKKCKSQLKLPTNLSITVKMNLYDCLYTDDNGDIKNITAISMLELDSLKYKASIISLHDKNQPYLLILDVEQQKNKSLDIAKLEKEYTKHDNNLLNIVDFIDDVIENETGNRIIGMVDIKVMLILQCLYRLVYKKNDFNVKLQGDCLVKGTKIQTPEGIKNIEDIKDEIICLDDNGNKINAKCKINKQFHKKIYKINIGDEVIECSSNHKFFMYDKIQGNINITLAKDLNANDEILFIENEKMQKMWNRNTRQLKLLFKKMYKTLFLGTCRQKENRCQNKKRENCCSRTKIYLSDLSKRILEKTVQTKRNLFQRMWTKIVWCQTKRKKQSCVYKNRRKTNIGKISRWIFNRRYCKNVESKIVSSSPKQIETTQYKNKRTWRTVKTDICNETRVKIENGTKWCVKSFLQTWKMWGRKKKPNRIHFKNETKLRMVLYELWKKTVKEERLRYSSYRFKSLQQRTEQFNDFMCIMPRKITHIEVLEGQKERETYDIDVPYYHNFILENGLVSHNSETGKTFVFKHYCNLLYGARFKQSSGGAISVPSLRGSAVSNLSISTSNKNRLGLLTLKDCIYIDEINMNPELIRFLRPFLLEDMFSNDKADGDKIEYKKNAVVNVAQNISSKHMGLYRGLVRKDYDRLLDMPTISTEDKIPWSETVDLYQPLHTYNNPILQQSVKNIRNSFHKKGVHWLDGEELPDKDRFMVDYLLVQSTNEKLLLEKLNFSQFMDDDTKEDYNLKMQLTFDNTEDLFAGLLQYKSLNIDEVKINMVKHKLASFIKMYNHNLSSRLLTFCVHIINLSRIINKRKVFEDMDFDIIKRFLYMRDKAITPEEMLEFTIPEAPDTTNIKYDTDNNTNNIETNNVFDNVQDNEFDTGGIE